MYSTEKHIPKSPPVTPSVLPAMHAQTDILDGQLSISGKKWLLQSVDEQQVARMCQELGLQRSLAELLYMRGVDIDHAADFLAPSLRQGLPDPGCLTDMDKAVTALAAHIQQGKRIAVFGDYDVDGTTSAALLARYFDHLAVPCDVYLPDRVLEGYGPNLDAFKRLKDRGAQLCITVDCGAMAHDVIAQAQSYGLDIIVVDHHQMTLPAPPAIATVNPNRPDDVSGLENLSAVGVTFMVLVGVTRALRQQGYFTGDKQEPPLIAWLDLVALGVTCDVMRLTGLARIFVAQGLKILGNLNEEVADRAYPGLLALAQAGGLKGQAACHHLGFTIGPRINAAGRMGHANSALQLMTTKDATTAVQWAQQLDGMNKDRQQVEADVTMQATALIEAQISTAQKASAQILFAAADGWHPGVIGIVAGRLKDKYHRPCIVISFDGDVGKGSGRSIDGVDLGGAIAAARRAGLLAGGGGHAMAAGVSLTRDQYESFQEFMRTYLAESLAAASGPPRVCVDSIVSLRAIHRDFIEQLAMAGPFGMGNPEPRFALRDVSVKYAVVKGGQHIALTLENKMGDSARAIAFRVIDTPLGDALLAAQGQKLQLVGKIKPDEWRGGRAAQLHIEDACL